ncbi:Cytochrome c [Vitis vinifera]|uniref:Cytochrome c n=1 Tax=Vitis vinifera TaxID=29760 RepID=A0A438D0L4_VITVI|nr:Cytochrome c [Vitis vinifera]
MRGIYSNWTAPIIPGEHGTNADLTANNLPRFSTLDQWTQKGQKSSTLWNSPLAQHAPLNHLKQTHTFSSTRFGNYSPPQETTTAPFRMATFADAPAGNAATGEKIFRTKCAQCHTVDKGAGHKQGLCSDLDLLPVLLLGKPE